MKQYDFDTVINRQNTASIKSDYFQDDCIPLWVADMDFPVADEIIEAAQKRLTHPLFGYTMMKDSLLEAVIQWFETRHQVSFPKEGIIPYYGVVSAMHLIIQALAKKKDSIAILSPVYMRFPTAVFDTGRSLRQGYWVCRNGKLQIHFESLETAMKESKILFLCNPHNPLGRVLTYAELHRIYQLAEKYQCLVVSDEIHCDLIMPGFKHLPFLNIHPKAKERTITLVSATKTFNLAQAGIAFIVCTNPDHKQAIEKVMMQYHLGQMNLLAMEMVEAAYRNGHDWLDQVNPYIYQNYLYVKTTIETYMPRIRVHPLEGSYLLWLDARRICEGVQTFFESMGHVRGIDGIQFGEEGEGHYRLNLASPRSVLTQAMKQLIHAYQQLYPKEVGGVNHETNHPDTTCD